MRRPRGTARARPTGEAAVFQTDPGEFDSRSPLRLRLLTEQDLRIRISGWRFESARSQCTAASNSPGGDVGLIRRARRVRFPGSLPIVANPQHFIFARPAVEALHANYLVRIQVAPPLS